MRARSKAQILGSSVTLPRGLARSNSKFIGREEIFYKKLKSTYLFYIIKHYFLSTVYIIYSDIAGGINITAKLSL